MAKHKVMDKAAFADAFLSEAKLKFGEAFQNGSTEDAGGRFLQARVSIDLVVSAKKKPPKPAPEPEPEPCCVCTRHGGGFVCVGSCCAEIILGPQPDTHGLNR